MKGEEPTGKVSIDSSQQAIVDVTKKLNGGDILPRFISQGHDMVTTDASYHAPCMTLLNGATEHVRCHVQSLSGAARSISV